MTIDEIRNIIIAKNGRINGNYKYLLTDEILLYLYQIYNTKNIKEIVYRLKNNIMDIPKCPICGNSLIFGKRGYSKTCGDNECINKLSFIKSSKTKLEKYGDVNYNNREKCALTKFEKYGDSHYVNSEQMKQTKLNKYGDETYVNPDKAKQTKLERYGNANYNNHNKTKQTCLNKYGVECGLQLDEIREKGKITKQEKYGDANYVNIDKAKQTKQEKYGDANYHNTTKAIETCLKNYGVKFGTQTLKCIINSHSESAKEKIINSKRKNKTFNTSNAEEETYKKLIKKYPNIIRQYKSDKYPFACDFYIPDTDTYIECNYFWMHMKHFFDEHNQEDINMLQNMKEKHTPIYDTAIYTWTDLDVRKHNIAIKNNLNYIVFWNINEFNNWINEIL